MKLRILFRTFTGVTTNSFRHNIQMNYGTGICTLEFKPDHSDLGQWMCKFTIASENGDEELGSATVVLLNSLGGVYFFLQ